MPRLIPQLVFVLAIAACGGSEDRTIEREVEILTGEASRSADVAEMRLVARGHRAILFLETGLWSADARGRRRVIRALRKIGDPEAAPIFRYLAENDPDEEVRDAARDALSSRPKN